MSDIEQYKAYLKDIGNIGSRHETARGFYITVLSALISFLALTGDSGPLKNVAAQLVGVVAIAGIAICVLWFFHTLSFSALYGAKLARVKVMEAAMTFKNFEEEYGLLKKDWRYTRLTYLECAVAVVFIGLFVATIKLK